MKFQRQRKEEVSLNLTPLIDVVFLLLIFFMVTTTFTKESHITIELPLANGEKVPPPAEELEVMISQDGHYFLNGQPLVDSSQKTLTQVLRQRSQDQADMPLIIAADARTPHQAVITAMQAAGDAGLVNFSITTQQTD